MWGTKLKDTNEKSNTLTKHSHELQRQMTFHYQKYKILQKKLCCTSSFLKGSFKSKNFEMDEPTFVLKKHVIYPNFLLLKSWFFPQLF
jgi:hypothetical protein